MNTTFTKYLFTFTCLWVITASLFGYRTLKNYDKDPVAAEKALAWEYGLVTLGAYGAGFAESIGILTKFMFKADNGYFRDYGNTPDPKFGHSVYDLLPERVGLTFFFVWMGIFWFWWPVKLLEIDTTTNATRSSSKDANDETTPLVKIWAQDDYYYTAIAKIKNTLFHFVMTDSSC